MYALEDSLGVYVLTTFWITMGPYNIFLYAYILCYLTNLTENGNVSF